MPRRAPVRRNLTKIVKETAALTPAPILEHELVTIRVDCMRGCGSTVPAEVSKEDIVPHLGRPRGFRKICSACSYFKKMAGVMPHAVLY